MRETNTVLDLGFHYVALGASGLLLDTDSNGLADVIEDVNGNGSAQASEWSFTDADTFDGNGLSDLQEYQLSFNVLVNDPAQDHGNEQNTQFETTCAVLNGRVIVAYVDANRGVYGLGGDSRLTNRTPRLVGYAVSHDGGVTFDDRDVPSLSRPGDPTNDDGDAGDPVLDVDRAAGAVYMVGTSPRNAGNKGIPLWKSTNYGVSFGTPTIALGSITNSDKPWIAVDNWNGTGQRDVYVMCTGKTSSGQNTIWLKVSTDGNGGNWTNAPLAIRAYGDSNVLTFNSPIPVIGSDHTAYVFWFERTLDGTNCIKMRQVTNRGTMTGTLHTVRQLLTTNVVNGNLTLKRSNTAAATD